MLSVVREVNPPPGEQGPPGKLPLVKLWMPETVYYAGDVVIYDASTFQARRNTGQPPSHADWVCLAATGRDGNSITVRGTFDETAHYRRLEVVARHGGSFVAVKDAPGPCPGRGWQLVASQGKRGIAGERGERGERGPTGLSSATIRDWKIDRARYVATPVMSDGRARIAGPIRAIFARDEIVAICRSRRSVTWRACTCRTAARIFLSGPRYLPTTRLTTWPRCPRARPWPLGMTGCR